MVTKIYLWQNKYYDFLLYDWNVYQTWILVHVFLLKISLFSRTCLYLLIILLFSLICQTYQNRFLNKLPQLDDITNFTIYSISLDWYYTDGGKCTLVFLFTKLWLVKKVPPHSLFKRYYHFLNLVPHIPTSVVYINFAMICFTYPSITTFSKLTISSSELIEKFPYFIPTSLPHFIECKLFALSPSVTTQCYWQSWTYHWTASTFFNFHQLHSSLFNV